MCCVPAEQLEHDHLAAKINTVFGEVLLSHLTGHLTITAHGLLTQELCFLGWLDEYHTHKFLKGKIKSTFYAIPPSHQQAPPWPSPPLCAKSFSTVSHGVTGVGAGPSIHVRPFKSTQVTCNGSVSVHWMGSPNSWR